MAITFSDYFTKAGKLLSYAKAVNTARGTTIPATVTNISSAFSSVSIAVQNAIAGIYPSNASVQQGCSAGPSAVRTAMSNFLQQTILADTNLTSVTDQIALQQLITEMVANSQSVKQTAVSAAVAAGGSNNGDAVVVASVKRGDGLLNENCLGEVISGTVTNATSPSTATISFAGQSAETDSLNFDWPLGSGCSQQVTAVSASSSLLTNGAFETSTLIANVPDNWIVSVGTIGTTLKMTVPEVQTLTVTGTPTLGTYQISWSNPAGKVQITAPIPYNASASQVQAALRALAGLSQVTVTATGASPNWTHTITFTGVAGNLSQITIVDNTTDSGTYTPGTTTNGSANAFIGLALSFVSNGSELTTIQQQLTNLTALTQYAFNFWAMVDTSAAAGVLTVDLVDGIGGSVINDAQGVANSFTIGHASLTTSFQAFSGVFRTPRVLPPLVYLRIRISTAFTNTRVVTFDQAALTAMTSLYNGGPSVAAFSGKNSLTAGDATNPPDSFTVTVTTDRGGTWQEWFDRIFDMKSKGLLLPSVTGGAETISNTLIA